MIKKLSSNQAGFSHYIIPIITVLVIAVVGVRVITASHAASSVSYVGFYNYAAAGNGGNTNTGNAGVFSTTDEVNGLGTQTVTDISPNSQLTYSYFPGKVSTSDICYYAKVYNSPKSSVQVTSANVKLGGVGNSRTVTIPADDNYHQECVPTSNGTQPTYNVINKSASAFILVYQAVQSYN